MKNKIIKIFITSASLLALLSSLPSCFYAKKEETTKINEEISLILVKLDELQEQINNLKKNTKQKLKN